MGFTRLLKPVLATLALVLAGCPMISPRGADRFGIQVANQGTVCTDGIRVTDLNKKVRFAARNLEENGLVATIATNEKINTWGDYFSIVNFPDIGISEIRLEATCLSNRPAQVLQIDVVAWHAPAATRLLLITETPSRPEGLTVEATYRAD